MHRRAMLSTAGLLTAGAVLAACVSSGSAAVIPAQITADLTGALQGLKTTLPLLAATTPPVISAAQAATLTADVDYGLSLLATVGPNTPAQTGVAPVAQAEAYLNAVLGALTSLPIPPPYNLVVMAAAVLAPTIEAYLASLMPSPPPVAPAATHLARMHHAPMSRARAREILHVQSATGD